MDSHSKLSLWCNWVDWPGGHFGKTQKNIHRGMRDERELEALERAGLR